RRRDRGDRRGRRHPPGGVRAPRSPRRGARVAGRSVAAIRFRRAPGPARLDPEGVGVVNEDDLRRIYADTKTIAVVGASSDPLKAGHEIPRYLQSQGYRILPVSPKGGELLGERVFTSLEEIDEPVDVVDVFRPPEESVAIAEA